jgi:hypothetical protein
LKRIKSTGDIFFAESDRPWVLEGANVHVSMIGFQPGQSSTRILDGIIVENIFANLSSIANISDAERLKANAVIGFIGPSPHARFDIELDIARQMLCESPNVHHKPNSDVIKAVVSGTDISAQNRNLFTIDFGILDLSEASMYESPFEYCVKNIRPQRTGKRGQTNNSWWQYERPRQEFRMALGAKGQFIATPRVSKHRIFRFYGVNTLANDGTTVFARSDDYFFGVLHSRLHEVWARAQGTQLR